MGNLFSCKANQEHLDKSEDENSPKLYVTVSNNPELIYFDENLLFNHAFGSVFKGSIEGKPVNVTKVHPYKMDLAQREAGLLIKLDHPNVIRYFFQYQEERASLFMVHELHEKTLMAFINKNMDWQDIMQQMTSAVKYLQSFNIVHLNLAPDSFFVVGQKDKKVVKLSNFISAAQISYDSINVSGKMVASKAFTAPEVYRHRTARLDSDNFSLGCIFFYIFSGGQHIEDIQVKSQANIIAARLGSLLTTNDHLWADLIKILTPYKSQDRISITTALNHPTFWNAQQKVNFIIEIAKLIEQDENIFRSCLYKGSKFVIGNGVDEDWSKRVEVEIMSELVKIRKEYSNRVGSKSTEYRKNIKSLVQQMRNILSHSNSPIIAAVMGTPELFIGYWDGKFPQLMLHLYNAKLNYETEISKQLKANGRF